MPKIPRALYFLPFLLALFLVASELVERSMYTDGVAYAGLSMNMANGIGTFWNPKLSEIHHFSFHEHPPLVFGIQSLYFRVFGDGIVTERLYAGSIFLLSGLLMILLWREALRDLPNVRRLWFVPLTIWLANEVVYHFYPANILEPTMILFTLGAVYACLRGVRAGTGNGPRYGLAILAGFLVFGAALCKGFVALFPLAFFGIYWLATRKVNLKEAVLLTVTMTAAAAIAFGVLWQHAPARESLTAYFDSQVMASLLSERSYENHHRTSRLYIVRRAFEVLIPGLLITALLIGIARWRGYVKEWGNGAVKAAGVFLLLGVAASLPLAVSPKQSFYYLLPSMGYFALGLGLLAAPEVAWFLERPVGKRTRMIMNVVAGILLVVALGNTARHWGEVTRRDRTVVNDVDQMSTVVPRGAVIGSVGDIGSIVSYSFRIHQLSLDTTVSKVGEYEFVAAPLGEDVSRYNLEVVPLEVQEFGLYRRKE